MQITERQAKILEAIVESYAEVASPVGSVTLAKLFNVSPATVRNEMARLEAAGLIAQPHTSAGRIPTDQGYRFYVNRLNQPSNHLGGGPVDRSARAIDLRVQHAGAPAQAIRSAVDSLAEITGNLGLATIGDQLYMSGLTTLFGQPEFSRRGGALQVARLLDNLEPWLREAAPNEPLNVYIGRENPIGKASECTLIVSRFRSPFSDRSYVGILGPTRQSYRSVMGMVKHVGELLEASL